VALVSGEDKDAWGMARQIILHQMNVPDSGLVELIGLAGTNDCRMVSIFGFNGATVLPARNASLPYPEAVTPESKAQVLNALAENGVAIDGIEFFPLTADVDLEIYKPALAHGRELGAIRAVAHIFIEDDALAVDRLGRFCELAEAEGLKISSEFCPMTAGNPSLARAKWLVDQVGRESFGIGVDLLHLIRSGGTVEDVAALDPRHFGIVQICDAKGTHVSSDYLQEVHNRVVPGQGDLPIRDFLNAVPAALPIEVEVPSARRRSAGVSAAEHVREVIAGARAVFETLAPVR
jgi:sugar phosphate isomerase/epimerase